MASRPSSRGRRPPPRSSGGRPRRRRERSDLGARILIAVPAAILVVLLIDAGGSLFALGMLALGIVCLHELYLLLAPLRPAKLAGFLALLGLVLAARFGGQFQIVLVAALAVPLVFGLTLAGPGRERPTLAMAATLLGIWWIGLAFAHVILLRDLCRGTACHGDGVLIDVLVGTFVGDTAAYFAGRAFGRRRLAPTISPSKTVEGLVAGMVVAVIAVWFAGFYQDWLSGGQAVLLGLAVAVAAPLGDLFESLVKRDAGTKDSGRLFGAHGGALDRLDAALFTVVAGYYVWAALA